MSNSTANNTSNPISRISIAAPALPIVTAATTTITSGYPAPKMQEKNNKDPEISELKSNEEVKIPTSIKATQMSKYPSTVSASSEITPNSISDYSDNEYIKQDILPKAKCSMVLNQHYIIF
ncbi:unnamed protein product [[Candida] boidinii]|nr:unnamed protein product [[Candida] boidinii]